MEMFAKKTEAYINLGLDRVEKILRYFGEPQNKIRSLLVGGTVGKGQTSYFLSEVLRRSGYKTGLYLSPHLTRINERITIDGENISDDELLSLSKDVEKAEEKTKTELTYFEHLTCIAFRYFYEKKVDFSVLEVGLGGRIDATNVANSELSVITKVGIDHENFLGTDIRNIAFEKAGIIKRNRVVVTGEKVGSIVYSVIYEQARANNSDIFSLKDFSIQVEEEYKRPFWKVKFNLENCKGTFEGSKPSFENLVLALVSALKLDLKLNIDLSFTGDFAGRFHIIERNPLIIFDGAHNIMGAEALFDFLFETRDKFVFIVGFLRDKRWKEIIKIFEPLAEYFIATEPISERALPSEILKNHLPFCRESVFIKNVPNVIKRLKEEGKNVCVTGSLYLVGGVLDLMKKE